MYMVLLTGAASFGESHLLQFHSDKSLSLFICLVELTLFSNFPQMEENK